MTDEIVDELTKCEHLESLAVGGFISREGVERLAQLPRLSSLSVSSSLLNETDQEELTDEFKRVGYFRVDNETPSYGPVEIGKDGLYRNSGEDGRAVFDAMEGKALKELLGDALDEELQKSLEGKVVLVEFWGTWCGPCLAFVPELKRLQNEYGERGFLVLAVHSKQGSEKANDHLNENPKPWPNLIDRDGAIQERFAVPAFPAIYLVSRDGKLRVSSAYPLGLDRSIQTLLKED